jgi:hypothetical protein
MGALTRLREELEELAGELDADGAVPDEAAPPEFTRALAAVDEARAALSSAFLSRRAMVVARDAVGRAHVAVEDARRVSRVLRDRGGVLRATADEIRSLSDSVRETGGIVAEWSRQLRATLGPETGQVVVESAIPAEHPHGGAIAAAVQEMLAEAGGRWQVWITVPAGAAWWGIRVRGPAIDWVGTLQDAAEQTPEGVTRRLEPLVQVALAELLYRRERLRGRHGPVDEA